MKSIIRATYYLSLRFACSVSASKHVYTLQLYIYKYYNYAYISLRLRDIKFVLSYFDSKS
jgi:hypothetical protein